MLEQYWKTKMQFYFPDDIYLSYLRLNTFLIQVRTEKYLFEGHTLHKNVTPVYAFSQK